MFKKNIILGLLFISTSAIAGPWQLGIQAYDINGNPYTGKAYTWQLIWAEEDFENGILVRTFTDGCMKGICEKKEFIKGTPYVRLHEENGVPLNGMIKTSPKKGGQMTQLGHEGLYINGVPDGLHKEFNETGLSKETMYNKGKALWKKEYENTSSFIPPHMRFEADMHETLYDHGVITDRYYKDNKKILEAKKLFDGRLIEISLYENDKILMHQNFNADGTSHVENFVNQTKKELGKNQIYNFYKDFGKWVEKEPYEYSPNDGVFRVVAGKRTVCIAGVSSFDSTLACSKDINTLNMIPTSAQTQLFFENPREFFSKNELGLDLSDVGKQDVRKLNGDLEKKMQEAMEMMKATMQGAMEGVAEDMLSTQTEDEFKETVQKKINESVSTTHQ